MPSATPAPRTVLEYAEAARELLNVGQPSQPALPPAPLHRPSPGQVPSWGTASAVEHLAGAGVMGALAKSQLTVGWQKRGIRLCIAV